MAVKRWNRHLTHIIVPIVRCRVQVLICVPQKEMIGKKGKLLQRKYSGVVNQAFIGVRKTLKIQRETDATTRIEIKHYVCMFQFKLFHYLECAYLLKAWIHVFLDFSSGVEKKRRRHCRLMLFLYDFFNLSFTRGLENLNSYRIIFTFPDTFVVR